MNILKITIIMSNLNLGGAQKVGINLANYYVSLGYQVDLIIFVNTGHYKKLINKNVNVINFNVDRNRYAIKKLRQYMKCNLDRLYLSVIRDVNIVVGIARLGLKIKSLIFREANTLEEINDMLLIKRKIYYLLLRLTYMQVNKIIANSYDTKKDLYLNKIAPKNKIITILNPVLPLNLKDLSDKNITEEWFIDNKFKVILSVGRLAKQKNYSFLIKCFYEIQKKYSCVRLVIIGEGYEKELLNNLIKKLQISNKVKILNFKDNVYPYYKYAHIFALTSDFEGFGNVLVEALSQGTKVVSTDCHGGPKMILKYGKYGKLIPVGNKEQYIKALEDILEIDYGYDNELIEYAINTFSVDKVAQKYLNVMIKQNI